VEPSGMRIPALVAAKRGENPLGLRGKVFLAMLLSQELAGPKPGGNSHRAKGKPVNIPAPPRYVR